MRIINPFIQEITTCQMKSEETLNLSKNKNHLK